MKKMLTLIFSFLVTCSLSSQTVFAETFENWSTPGTFLEPNNWFTSNTLYGIFGVEETVLRTSDAHSGSYAANLVSQADPEGSTRLGAFMTQGSPISGRPLYLTGWHKFITDGDTVSYYVNLTRYDASVDSTKTVGNVSFDIIEGQSEYVAFSQAINYTSPENPDTVFITIAISDIIPSQTVAYSLDDLSLGSSSGFSRLTNQRIGIFPNPANEFIGVTPFSGAVQVSFYDVSGRLTEATTLHAGVRFINTSSLKNGVYAVTFASAKNGLLGNEKLVISR